MNKSIRKIHNQGFTLIELLTVIAIIGILATIIVPTVGKVQEKAQKAKAQSNARQIALAYNSNFATDNKRIENAAVANIHEWAFQLATASNLNDASIWFVEVDDAITAALPKSVFTTSGGTDTIDTTFDGSPVAWAAAAGIPKTAPASTTPILWSRGLQTTGVWDDAISDGGNSIWGTEGGHIAYVDGHVDWVEGTAEFVESDGTISTNFNDAIGSGTTYEYTSTAP